MNLKNILTSLLLVVTAISGSLATPSIPVAELGFKITPSQPAYSPGDTVILSLDVTIPAKYHLYGNPLGPGIGKPLLLSVEGAAGVTWLGQYKLPAEKVVQFEEEWVWGYAKETHFFFKGILTENAAGTVSGEISVDGQFCHTACIQVKKKVPFSITAGAYAGPRFPSDFSLNMLLPRTEPMPSGSADAAVETTADPTDQSAIPRWSYVPVESGTTLNILLALLFAFIAGIILNAMPCVLPVLGVKILSFAKEAEGSRRTAILHSAVFSAGMIAVFMVLASLAAFAKFSWGQQFQNPFMLVGIVCLIFVFALGMFDAYMILVPAGVGNLERKSGTGYGADLLRGMFTTVLATPCSGPFLGATLAWTLTQPPVVIYCVFGALGLGMASPYLLLSASRRIAALIPKPGEWMNDFKRIMGYLLLGFAVYLLIGIPRDLQVSAVGMCLALAVAVGVYTRLAPFGASIARKTASALAALAVVGLGIYVNFAVIYGTMSNKAADAAHNSAEGAVWEPFSPEKLLEANAAGEDAVVDFTANWCMNCQFNTVMVLETKPVKEMLTQKKVRAFIVDMTNTNPAGESLLHHLGSRSIPFFAVFPGDDPQHPVIMRDILKKSDVLRELGKLKDAE